jgi:hypothetical protein
MVGMVADPSEHNARHDPCARMRWGRQSSETASNRHLAEALRGLVTFESLWGGPRGGESDRYFEPTSRCIGSADFATMKPNRALCDCQA